MSLALALSITYGCVEQRRAQRADANAEALRRDRADDCASAGSDAASLLLGFVEAERFFDKSDGTTSRGDAGSAISVAIRACDHEYAISGGDVRFRRAISNLFMERKYDELISLANRLVTNPIDRWPSLEPEATTPAAPRTP